ncbi:hypothetical protein MA16_Dca012848 [Dendrobium catenatum]|uniref:Uncharacterized protein n=1 Tax=Dendrobium catenatum TaxID=906689 RepID=A0A2I0VXR7_9ASPA|nr:hypothetical protein MA16_Dca012848 [Dendrobium catenatum]
MPLLEPIPRGSPAEGCPWVDLQGEKVLYRQQVDEGGETDGSRDVLGRESFSMIRAAVRVMRPRDLGEAPELAQFVEDQRHLERETGGNRDFSVALFCLFKFIVIVEGDPHPGALRGRMSFQSFNPSIDKLNEEATTIHQSPASNTSNGNDNISYRFLFLHVYDLIFDRQCISPGALARIQVSVGTGVPCCSQARTELGADSTDLALAESISGNNTCTRVLRIRKQHHF